MCVLRKIYVRGVKEYISTYLTVDLERATILFNFILQIGTIPLVYFRNSCDIICDPQGILSKYINYINNINIKVRHTSIHWFS